VKLACVIGAGLVGSQVATALEEQGYVVVIIDDKRPLSGSAAAACLVKPEWCRSLGSLVTLRAFEFLERYERHNAEGIPGAFFYEPRDILRKDVVEAEVVDVRPNGYGATVVVDVDDPDRVPYAEFSAKFAGIHTVKTSFDVVVVAAGVWTPALLKHVPNHQVEVTGKMGSAIVWNGKVPALNFIREWAPYKQVIGLQRTHDYWLGDGTAILQANYSKERKKQSVDRCLRYLAEAHTGRNIAFPDHIIDGIRPYTPEPSGVCRQVSPGLWAAVGARKFGTVIGAYCAWKIAKEVP
jgi:glycine/D-amino acid oxidase-like deaminating enzyme